MGRNFIPQRMLLLSVSILIMIGCQPPPATPPEVKPVVTITITSPAFSEGDSIPENYTCDGDDVSPPLEWTGLPNGTQSLTLIVDDPDAPVGTWVHWVIFDIPPSINGFPEGIARSEMIEGTGTQGKNDSRQIGYIGPCPPKGKPHRYFFKLYALDVALNLKAGVGKSEVEKAMRNHILAQGQLIGTYGR